MKTRKVVLLIGALLISAIALAQLAAYVTAPAAAMGITEPNGPTAVTALPVIENFESGLNNWFQYGDYGNGAAWGQSLVLTTSLSSVGVTSNTVTQVDYVAAGWGVGGGQNIVPFQDWSAYDGFSFWFHGSNSGTVFKIILTDNGGERLATKFTDNFTGWKELTFPWQVFYWDPDFQPDWNHNDGPTLTAVEAYAFAPTGAVSGTFYLDQVKLFKNTGAVAENFQSGLNNWFQYGDYGNGAAWGQSLVLTTSLSSVGVTSNTVTQVDYVAAGWGVGGGQNIVPFQDWSAYDGFSFWFHGSNSGTVFKIILTDNGGERLATKFTDNFTGWKELTFPWQVFYWDPDFQPDWNHNDGPTLTAVEAYAFAPTGAVSGTFYLDQVKLFKNTGAVAENFQSGLNNWFQYGDYGNGAAWGQSLVLTTSLSSVGVTSNTVTQVDYVAAGWGVGGGQNIVPFQDWSAYDGFSFWFHGSNSGTVFKIILTDNGGERLATKFTDNFTGWKELSFPWQVFYWDPDFQPDWNHNDGPTLTAVEAYAFAPTGAVSGTFYLDQVKLFQSTTGAAPIKADFTSSTYSVNQGGTATVTVQLTAASAVTVTVDYSTTNGTAIAGTDYLTASGTLTFTPGITTANFSVTTIGTAVYGPNKTIGLGLGNANGATIGALHTPATLTIVNDNPPPDVKVIEDFEAGLPQGKDLFANPIGFSTWGSTQGNVAITTTSGMTYTGGTLPNTVLAVTSNIESWGGFTDAFKDDQTWGHQDWSRYDGVRFWFYGTNSGKLIQIEIFDNRQLENLGDSAERWYQRFTDDFSGWQQISLPFAQFQRRSDYQPGGAPNDGLNLTDVSGLAFNMPSVASTTLYYVDQIEVYGDLSQHPATTRLSFSAYGFGALEGDVVTAKLVLNQAAAEAITVTYVITPDTASPTFDFTGDLSGTMVFAAGEVSKTVTLPTVDDSRVEAREQLEIAITSAAGAPIGYVGRSLLAIIDNDVADPAVLDDFENGVPVPLDAYGNVTVTTQSVLDTSPIAVPGQDPFNTVLSVTYDLPTGAIGGFTRKFETPQDLSQSNGLSFWYYGSGSGKTMTVTLLDNGQPDPGPTNWTLAWSDEFSGTAGTAPNPANWGYDIGGQGYGNNEWEYYTDSRDNSALDGNGNLVITAISNTNPAYTCATSPTGPNGPCYATSARLLSAGKQEFTHGRVEARLRIPKGQGIWPAFWMLGNDIFTTNPWPASGEIDIMENIGKVGEQTKVYGTIHGPGYSGGGGIGRSYDVTPTVLADDFHTYAIEWEPTQIRWYLDGYNYFTATDQMIPAGADWVFNHPFFIIMNVAVGGNWPGYPDATTVLPQQMAVDYVRVYQAPDTAERFESAFVDNFVGWRKVVVPFSNFKRSATQPDNGLTLTAAQGYRFDFAGSPTALNAASALNGAFYMDEVRVANLTKVYLPIIRR